jgi:hypothetical protein
MELILEDYRQALTIVHTLAQEFPTDLNEFFKNRILEEVLDGIRERKYDSIEPATNLEDMTFTAGEKINIGDKVFIDVNRKVYLRKE